VTGQFGWPYPRYFPDAVLDAMLARQSPKHLAEEEHPMDEQVELDEVTGRDLDETRRLLYMVLFDGLQSERWFNLAGTLVNALAYHSQLMGADEAMNDLRAIRAGTETAEHWALPLIRQINQRIASGGQ